MFFTLTQIPQPIHNSSEIHAIFELGATSIHSFPKEERQLEEKKAHKGRFLLISPHLVRELTHSNDWTGILAFLATFLRLALILTHNSDTAEIICHYLPARKEKKQATTSW